MKYFFESATIALQAIWGSKLRSFLTVLGNIVAVTSIIAVVSLVQGMNAYVTDAIVSGVGVDNFTILERDPGLARIAQLMLPATLGQAATQINFLVDTWLASRYGDGPITWLSLAFRLIQLPIGLFGVAVGTVALPTLSRHVARDDATALGRTIRDGLEVSNER